MEQRNLKDVSDKLTAIIQTRDLEKVRYWSRILERQKDPMITVEVFILIRRQLQAIDSNLNQWFEEVYFEDYQPEMKKLWLNFVDLCSLSL